MPRVQLTDRFIAGAKADGRPQVDYFDAKTPGLTLRVSASGVKSWNLFFTSPKDGRRARMTLGRYPQTALAGARTLALEARRDLGQGVDPRDLAAGRAAGDMTVAGLIASYMSRHARPNLRSADALERLFRKDVLPIIGEVRLADLHRRDVNRVLDAILARGSPVEAARTFAYLRAMFRWAVGHGDLDHSPMDGMRKPRDSAPRERVLNDDEIRTLWTALPSAIARSRTCQRILKLCLVTGQRVGEIAGMRLDELALDQATWTLPASRTKNGHTHVVPLSPIAVDIIHEAIADAGDGAVFVFSNDASDGPFDVRAVAHTIRRAKDRIGLAPWTAHDLRRTAATGMARLGIAPIVIGNVLNHRTVTKAGVTLSVYSHYDYAQEKRDALELWADRILAVVDDVSAGQVLPMTRERHAS